MTYSETGTAARLGEWITVEWRLRRIASAVAVIGGPVGFLIGGLLSPTVQFDGAALIAANVAAGPLGNAAHLVAFGVASLLLPVSVLAMAGLVRPRSPWAAMIGGALGLLGWTPLAALTALDGLIYTMAQQPGRVGYPALLDAFYQSRLMMTFLLVYIVGHLLTYVVLGVALERARVTPRWAARSMVASSPLTILMFALPGNPQWVGGVALGLLVAGSVPIARALLQHAQAPAAPIA